MGDPGDVIRYNAYKPTYKQRRWVGWTAVIVITAGCVAMAAWGHLPSGLLFSVVLGLVIGILFSFTRNVGFQIVVGPKQVRGPARVWLPWPRRVAWSNVRGVECPGRHSDFVTLQLRSGEAWEFGLPASYRQEVARIGNLPRADSPESRHGE